MPGIRCSIAFGASRISLLNSSADSTAAELAEPVVNDQLSRDGDEKYHIY